MPIAWKKFDPEQAYDVLERFGVQNAFIPPTALRIMRDVGSPESRWSLNLPTIASGKSGARCRTLKAEGALGAHVNEFYGQTECNMILGNCADLFQRKPGSMGRVLPGRSTRIIDPTGGDVPDGTVGELACSEGDPVMMLGYWR